MIQPSNSTSKPPSTLHPPLRAHISKRDTRSFFLHWIPNPLNEHRTILGYRIYIDDVCKGAIDSGRFEAIIDYIRDEGEYKIKLRTYDQYGESGDSNVVVARFRRQRSVTPNSEAVMIVHPTQSEESNQNVFISPREYITTPIVMPDQRRPDTEQNNVLLTPEKQIVNRTPSFSSIQFGCIFQSQSNERISPGKTTNDNIVSRKPPKSPTSSPNRAGKTSPNNGSCNKVLFANNDPTKRSPTRTGIMSRLAKNSQNNKRNNNILLNALPIELTHSPTESVRTKTTNRIITFQPDLISDDHGHIIAQQVPLHSSDVSNSMNIHHLSTNSETLSSDSPPPPPIPPRIAKTTVKIPLDQYS